MSPSIAYLLKMVLVSGVLYAYYHAVLRDKRFHQWNRFYLLAAVLLSVTLPLFHIPIYQTEETDNRLLFEVLQMLGKGGGKGVVVTGAAAAGLSWMTLAGYIYATVVLVQLGLLGVHLLRLRRLRRRSPQARVDGVTLVTTEDKGTPFSFFHWIFWNRSLELDSVEGRRILRHELTHVHQGHSVDKVALELVCIVFFPVVFLYLIRRELQLIHEYLADKQAARDEDLADYARLLVSQAFQASPYAFANSFFQHPLKRRLAMMTRFSNPRYTYLRKIMFLPLALVLFGLLAFRVEAKHPAMVLRLQAAAVKIQDVFLTPIAATSEAVVVKPAPKSVQKADLSQRGDTLPAVRVIGYASQSGSDRPSVTVLGYATRPSVTVVGHATPPADTVNPLSSGAHFGLNDFVGTDSVVFLIDGQVVKDKSIISALDPGRIQSITVLKDAAAVQRYGASSAHGVVEITLKESTADNPNDPDRVFTKVEVEAQFAGGDAAWNDYVLKTITVHMDELQKEAKSGTCELMFVVNKDGTVSGAEALSMRGTVLARICVDAIERGPRWVPAQQNGHVVSAFRKQKVTFQMPD